MLKIKKWVTHTQRIMTPCVLSILLSVQLPLSVLKLECQAQELTNFPSIEAFASQSTDDEYSTLVSKIGTTINANIELNEANHDKANTEPTSEVAYEVVKNEPALYISESEHAYNKSLSNPIEDTGYYTNINGYELYVNPTLNPNWDSSKHITSTGGVCAGPSGKETYYNLPMGGVVKIMRRQGFDEENWPYWEREDGCKMLGDYIMVAADLSIRPRGSLVETSMGMGIVCDTGEFIYTNQTQLDIAVTW